MKYRILTLVIIVASLAACKERNTDSSAYIQQLFEERVGRLIARIEDDCREEVMRQAQLRADSLLIQRARRMKRIEGRPPRPRRPGEPPAKELSAPLPLRPLFPFEIRFDTLLRDSLLQDSLLQDSLLQLRELDFSPE
ncbi:hypothetical protein [Lewinella sp. 4G2]|uniref:hypothetical protein n=1 Tax=Lewinella sp. 4G2 TaxID=1803372 RepID=UPI0007B4A8DF|nr:hypothetical protein [Lewinella sp. 4G2]OAV45980.1 hypothetical protein A3850_018980 [Lewinella sp. 4G2]